MTHPDELPSSPTPGALRAVEHAYVMLRQTDPAIWYDSWSNDARDNDGDGRIDEPDEQTADGVHGGVRTARIAPSYLHWVPGLRTTAFRPSSLVTISVTYKVCTDIPIECYRAARVPMSHRRNVNELFADLRRIPGWRVWERPEPFPALKAGDVVASSHRHHSNRQHAGILARHGYVINLPGPSHVSTGYFFHSALNDVIRVWLPIYKRWPGYDLVARWIHPD